MLADILSINCLALGGTGWGNYITIDHDNSEFSEFGHFGQDSIVVKEGERVERGRLPGHCGKSVLAIASHIHYQLQNAGIVGAETVPTLRGSE